MTTTTARIRWRHVEQTVWRVNLPPHLWAEVADVEGFAIEGRRFEWTVHEGNESQSGASASLAAAKRAAASALRERERLRDIEREVRVNLKPSTPLDIVADWLRDRDHNEETVWAVLVRLALSTPTGK